ncbi:hypothetical protein PUMCH_000781 [Australozyma saopauloensis]|uniref:Uncharacterized protein n=1 Tax=Australozyma saopauloensis TaxID=291208 RepID=A0AAX4H4Y3_9ASCO|nr:hypothetical protein PUMCH_000781 [[Candida] saopauloensis]
MFLFRAQLTTLSNSGTFRLEKLSLLCNTPIWSPRSHSITTVSSLQQLRETRKSEYGTSPREK